MSHRAKPLRSHTPALMFIAVASWLATGCALLLLATIMPPFYAHANRDLAENALAFISIGLAALGAVFLPVWAPNARTAGLNVFSAVVIALLGGAVQGSSVTETADASARLFALMAAIATIWMSIAKWPGAQRFAWLSIVLWSLGLPAAAFLMSEGGPNQDLTSTFLHFSPATLLR